jgi:hypothetical protein
MGVEPIAVPVTVPVLRSGAEVETAGTVDTAVVLAVLLDSYHS